MIDKDLCFELPARELEADLFIMATDAAGVHVDFGKREAKVVHRSAPAAMGLYSFPAKSMGPEVDAACHFATATGKTAAIGALADIPAIAKGQKGTRISTRFDGVTFHA